MINELAKILNDFPGASNQTHCFAHILNLVVKSILTVGISLLKLQI